MKVAFITTVRHNVGDDFVRDGLEFLLRRVHGDFQVGLIHKHLPLLARPEFGWFRGWHVDGMLDRLRPGLALRAASALDRLPLGRRTDEVLNCDLLVQSGAPVIWLNKAASCAANEWYEPLIRRRWRTVRDRVPFFSIAGGTCQHYDSDGSELAADRGVREYLEEFLKDTDVFTVRDSLSQRVLRMIGLDAPALPCTSIFARRLHQMNAGEPEYVALNYMPSGGHYDFNGEIDPGRWTDTFVSFARDLHARERCVLVCHNRSELAEAQRLLPEMPRLWSENHVDYLGFYSRAKFGVLNRVHGAFALASFGRPSLVIGSDSRARMAEMIGLRSVYVGNCTRDHLDEALAGFESGWRRYRESFRDVAERTEVEYLQILERARSRMRSAGA